MTDWEPGVMAAIARLQSRTNVFPEERTLGLIDRFAIKGSLSKQELLALGPPYFTQVVLGHVTSAVHGGGKLPKLGGWYRVRPGKPHQIDLAFAAAWISARQNTRALPRKNVIYTTKTKQLIPRKSADTHKSRPG